MKSVYQGLAVLTHPVFLPLFSILIYMPFLGKYSELAFLLSSLWLGAMYFILPIVYFKWFRKVNLAEPTMDNRRTIFKTYMLINAGFSLVSIFLITEYFGFFVASALLHAILMFLVYIEMKASWHSAIWSFLSCAMLMIIYRYGFVNAEQSLLIFLGVLAVVIFLRWKQKAHTLFELGMGVAAGAISSIFILFLSYI